MTDMGSKAFFSKCTLHGVDGNFWEVEPLEVRSIMCVTICEVAKSNSHITSAQQGRATRFVSYTVVVLLIPIPLENPANLAVAGVVVV